MSGRMFRSPYCLLLLLLFFVGCFFFVCVCVCVRVCFWLCVVVLFFLFYTLYSWLWKKKAKGGVGVGGGGWGEGVTWGEIEIFFFGIETVLFPSNAIRLPSLWLPEMGFNVNTYFDVSSVSPPRGRDIKMYTLWYKLTELVHSFHSLLAISVFTAISTTFSSINAPNSSPFFHSVLPVLFLSSRSFKISLYESLLQPWYNPQWLTGLKTPNN